MKILSWNCRGLGNRATVRTLKKLLRVQNPDIVFLMETKILCQRMCYLNSTVLKFRGCFPVDCRGHFSNKRGGLCVLWNDSVELELISFSSNHISFSVTGHATSKWVFIGLYGWADQSEKYLTYDLMKRVCPQSNTPTLYVGDFNEILWFHEKQGGNFKSMGQMEKFRSAIEACNLNDLGYTGYTFTWTNGRSGDNNVQERLDRFLASDLWREKYQYHQVHHLPRMQSDHAPIILTFDRVNKVFAQNSRKRKRLFRFEKVWLEHPGCEEIVNKVRRIPQACSFMDKVNQCAQRTHTLNTHEFGNISPHIKADGEKDCKLTKEYPKQKQTYKNVNT
ncbi:hypothetical protein DH2020_023020 [Rehmannia glutinosa]|uniref:Endonuclease/exonuclease/phosphatase domain-containing protein n=1 Tax=Rehmannia glutinosa TaxID=99300 RepID=A0ABR0W5P7_REHGL